MHLNEAKKIALYDRRVNTCLVINQEGAGAVWNNISYSSTDFFLFIFFYRGLHGVTNAKD